MRALGVVTLLTLTGWTQAYAAEPPRVAVFDFEMIDTSLQGQVYSPREDQRDRLLKVGDQLRNELGGSGKFQIAIFHPSMLRRIRAICGFVADAM